MARKQNERQDTPNQSNPGKSQNADLDRTSNERNSSSDLSNEQNVSNGNLQRGNKDRQSSSTDRSNEEPVQDQSV